VDKNTGHPKSARARSRRISLRLYVAGHAPNSVSARTNLQSLIRERDNTDEPVALEVVDVLKEPLRAFQDGVLVSPTLVRLFPMPVVRIVGNLSDLETVRSALGLSR
jgi:circadian clock protein KaiB